MAVRSTGAMELSTGISLASPCLLKNSALLTVHRPASFHLRAATTTPPQQDEQGGNPAPSESFRLEPRKKQQRRRSQWSKGDAPGEYGGPPLDFTIRRSWGGNGEDPLMGTGDYIWKKKWQPFVQAPPSAESTPTASQVKEPDSGFLSLNRAIALDSMDVDLTEELLKPSRTTLERQLAEAQQSGATAVEKGQTQIPRWRLVPTRREEALWAKGRKAMSGGSEVMAREVGRLQIDLVADAERQRLWYLELKRNLQLLTLGIGGLGTTCAYLAYSPEIAGSYGAGLIGALAYIRMLGNSVDGLGANSAGGAARGALGSPRLLIPVLLVMVYNRWNMLLVPQYDILPLDLIPMLLGFFTYKAATLVETFKELFPLPSKD